ncbi:DUF960 family protein [Vallitalea okinawensis]|uniref:DUF960 family protein n=1 Tax=Vallitalea okinawensis TaxID=2078660 RepID=UPI000CFC9C16|nr:DUF960 family protein [Vallitalea okinawensis]
MLGEGKKYITKGVQSRISLDLQLLMWQLIEELTHDESEIDYLQVFKLTTRSINDSQLVLQQVKHTQEVPAYESIIIVKVDQPVNEKIFVITSTDEDGSDYKTMMLAEEW